MRLVQRTALLTPLELPTFSDVLSNGVKLFHFLGRNIVKASSSFRAACILGLSISHSLFEQVWTYKGSQI